MTRDLLGVPRFALLSQLGRHVDDRCLRSLLQVTESRSVTLPIPSLESRVFLKRSWSTSSQVAVAASVVVSGLVSTLGALSLQRSIGVVVAGACDGGASSFNNELDVATSPTRLEVGPSPVHFLRGALVGNVFLVWMPITMFLLLLCGAVTYHRSHSGSDPAWKRKPLRLRLQVSAAALSVPSHIWTVVSLLLQPTLTTAVTLLYVLQPSSLSGGDVGLCVLVFLLVIAITVWVGSELAVSSQTFLFHCVRQRARKRSGQKLWVLTAQWKWRPRRSADALRFALYGDWFRCMRHNRHWWPLLELGCTLILGVVNGLVSEQLPLCDAILYTNTAVTALLLIGLVWLRPYDVPVDLAVAILNQILTLVLCALVLAKHDDDSVAITTITVMQAALSITPLVVSLFSILFLDGPEALVRHLLRYFTSIVRHWIPWARSSPQSATVCSSSSDSSSDNERTARPPRRQLQTVVVESQTINLPDNSASPATVTSSAPRHRPDKPDALYVSDNERALRLQKLISKICTRQRQILRKQHASCNK